MAGTAYPFVKPQFFDNNGDPAAGYKLFTYIAGTQAKQATYTDANLTSANANPIILDGSGRASIFLLPASYQFVLGAPNDTDPPASPIWTVDGVAALAPFATNVDIPAVAGENLALAEVCYMSDGAIGGTTAGRWYRADADSVFSSSIAPVLGFPTAAISSGDTGSIRIAGRIDGLGGLATGSRYNVSATAGQLTTSELANHRFVGQADSATSLILAADRVQFRDLVFEFGRPGGGVLTTGVNKYVRIPYSFLFLGWTILAEQSGSVVIDVWSDTYANFPPTVADTIAGSEKPTLTAAQKNEDQGLSTWTLPFVKDNVLGFNVDSVATVNYVSLTFKILMV